MTAVDLPSHPSAGMPNDASPFVSYDLLVPPLGFGPLLEPYEFVIAEDEAQKYVEWVRASEVNRLDYSRRALIEAGAPLEREEEDRSREELIALGRWVVEWASILFSAGPLGPITEPKSGSTPTAAEPIWSKVMVSLAHDLAFLVVDAVRRRKPDLDWYLSLATGRRIPGLPGGFARLYRPAFQPAQPGLLPITTCLQVLNRASLGPPSEPRILGDDGVMRGGSSASWDRSMAHPLQDLHDALLREPPQIEELRQPGITREWPFPERPFRRLLKARTRSGVAPEVVEAVSDLRAAGWFEERPLSDVELAASLTHTWMVRHDGDLDLMDYPELLDQCLIAMDDRRSTYESARPDADQVNQVYRVLVPQLARITGVEAHEVNEQWSSDLSEVRVSFRLEGSRQTFTLPDCDRYVSPKLVTEFNGLIPRSGRRLWFPEHPINEKLILTSATYDERDALQSRRPLRLVLTPPDWWRELLQPPDQVDR